MARRGLTALALLALVGLGLLNVYLLMLLAAAARGLRRAVPAANPGCQLRFVVLVPARDEERSIGEALASVHRLDYPAERFDAIVIADNCTDRTADVAVDCGATVWRRRDDGGGGKGAALAWGLDRLAAERPDADAVVLVDADCVVAPNLLTALEARLRAGAVAVQVPYGVANPSASWTAALRYASFALVNLVRPLGKATLGLSAGLFGTGMAFSTDLLARQPWTARSLVEDQEYHVGLVAAGDRVAFAHETGIASAMPTTLRRSTSQHLRWEAGRGELLRKWSPRLLAAGVRRRDAVQIHAAAEALVPPQSLLLATNAASAVAAWQAPPAIRRLALANVAAQAAFVTGGLLLVGAPARVWRALALAPGLMVWKLGLLMRLWLGRGPTSWVRTGREPPAGQARAAARPRVNRPERRRPIRRS